MDWVAGLDGLTVKTCCLSGYSHYLPPQPPAQLSPIAGDLHLSGSDVVVRERKSAGIG